MTDKELLELAAKASGFGDKDGNICWTESEYPPKSGNNGAFWNYVGYMDTAELWNPLTSIADCFRLETALEISIAWYQDCIVVWIEHNPASEYFADHNGDKDKARRYASVRAAAEIGKQKE
jgi:hypothetical protein